METLVQLSNLTKIYDGAGTRPAVDAVTLDIPEGGATAIMGPSGSGKSTLLNLIAGLDRPTQGSIRVAGEELNGLSESSLARYRRRSVGLIFQFFNLLDNLTVLDNVLIPAQLAGAPRSASLQRARELLTNLDIADQASSYPARLSGGQRQRVAIARALINRPILLLADEPTGALDSGSGEVVVDMLRDLNRSGQTIVLVTHDARLANRCADRIVTLVDGAIGRQNAALEARA
jgi:putative ABC transport system ATP-binding protein